MRSIKWALALAAAAITVLTFNAASAQGTLRIGMTASDIPLTTGQTDQGGEGMRFMGYTVYDGLINWDLSSFDKPSDLVPGLATSYGVDPADASKNKWIFKIREGVKFHDGSEFTADTAVWNFDKLLKNDSPQFDQRQSAQGRSRIPSVASYKAVDKYTLEIVTKSPDASLPYQTRLDHDVVTGAVGEARQELGSIRQDSVGHRALEAHAVRATRTRRNGSQQGVLGQGPRFPSSTSSSCCHCRSPTPVWRRCAPARSIGSKRPPPTRSHRSKSAGFKIITNAYPHNWTWHLSRVEGSPWNDIRVRKAANLAIDREGMQELLSGLMIPAEGFMPPGHQWFGKPTFKLKYEPAEAKKLLKEAGYGPDKPLVLKALISPSGSGQMQPLPMNEFIQQNLAEVGIKVDFEVVEWNQLINIWRAGATDPSAKGGHEPQLHLLHPGSVHRIHPAHAMQPESAERHQLGLIIATRRWTSCSMKSATASTRRSRPPCCRRCTRKWWTRRCS